MMIARKGNYEDQDVITMDNYVKNTGLFEKNPAKKSRPKKAKKIHPKFDLSGWLFLAFIEKCVFY